MYKVTIGLEVHCELKTISKVFSTAPNTYSETPNINIEALDLAFPGTMPVVNEKAVTLALKTALALNCKTTSLVIFDRKNYFYPDLAKGYQITQATIPMGKDGFLIVNVNGKDKKVYIKQLHLEEDTASLDHYDDYSLLDYNRSGIPLIEVVSEPCLHSSDETIAFLEALRSVFLYCEVSEAKSDKGQMRCDVNISLNKKDSAKLGVKVELKNINSFNNVKEAIEYEIKRQQTLLNKGKKVVMETRRFDSDTRKTYSMRTKALAVDYKHFIDPNLPIIKLDNNLKETLKKSIPKLQHERILLYMNEYQLSRYDATILVKYKEVADFFEEAITYYKDYKEIANWVNGLILSHLNKYQLTINELFLKPKMLVELIKEVAQKKISLKQAKEVLYQSLDECKSPLDLIKQANISQISDDDELRSLMVEVLTTNQEAVSKYISSRRGNMLDFFVGQIMKKTKGKADPVITYRILKEELAKIIKNK